MACAIATALTACTQISTPTQSDEKTTIRVVGSSTVYPFSTKVAQEFRNKTGQSVIVEATGSGGGHKLFCAGSGSNPIDIVNSSRQQKVSEVADCKANGVRDVVEIPIGYDGIVVANAIDSTPLDISPDTLFLALAKHVPTSPTDCTLIDNPYERWNDIDPALPDFEIEVYGPPPTSGTRDAFVEIAMESGAERIACLTDLSTEQFERAAHILREDGHWIDAGESDNALIHTLVNTPSAVGVFGYSFLDQNLDKIRGARIGGVEPTFENITTGDYPVARSLYVYVNAQRARENPALRNFALEFVSDEAAGQAGYLEKIGLIPVSKSVREETRAQIVDLQAGAG